MRIARGVWSGSCVAAGALAVAGGLVQPGVAQSWADAGGGSEQSVFLLPPGEYRTAQELIAFDLPGLSEAGRLMAREAFAEGAAVPYSFCVSEGKPHGEWLSDMVESDCTLMHFFVERGVASIGLACRSEVAIDGPVQLTGTTHAQGAEVEVTFTEQFPARGDGTIRMRIMSERVGECG